MKRRQARMVARHPWRSFGDHFHRQFPVPNEHDQHERTKIVVQVRKSVMVLYVWMLIFSIFLTVALVRLEAQRHDAHTVLQASRFDSAYRSCVSTDMRHTHALLVFSKASPALHAAADTLIDAVAPMRDDCTAYALVQIAEGDGPQQLKPKELSKLKTGVRP